LAGFLATLLAVFVVVRGLAAILAFRADLAFFAGVAFFAGFAFFEGFAFFATRLTAAARAAMVRFFAFGLAFTGAFGLTTVGA
jgi:hypothetical protein